MPVTTQAQVDLCNQAFRALGEKAISLPLDTANPRWLLASQFYDQVQDDLLTTYFWNFATLRAVLTPAGGVTPAYEYAYAFAVPEDYLAIQRVTTYTEYQREGAYFVSNEPTLPLTYTARITDVTLWPAYFTQAFVAALTATFAEQVTGQLQKVDLLIKLAEAKLHRARARDGQEGTPPVLRADALVIARRGGGRP